MLNTQKHVQCVWEWLHNPMLVQETEKKKPEVGQKKLFGVESVTHSVLVRRPNVAHWSHVESLSSSLISERSFEVPAPRRCQGWRALPLEISKNRWLCRPRRRRNGLRQKHSETWTERSMPYKEKKNTAGSTSRQTPFAVCVCV